MKCASREAHPSVGSHPREIELKRILLFVYRFSNFFFSISQQINHVRLVLLGQGRPRAAAQHPGEWPPDCGQRFHRAPAEAQIFLLHSAVIYCFGKIAHFSPHFLSRFCFRINSSPHNRKQRNSSTYVYDDDSQRNNRQLPLEMRRLRHGLLDQTQQQPPPPPPHQNQQPPQQQKFQRYYIYNAAPRRRSLPAEEIDGFMADKNQLFKSGTRPSSAMKAPNGSSYDDATVAAAAVAAYRKVKKRSAADDKLSKNITLILENLLKSYENSQMPTHGQGELEKMVANSKK